MEGRGPGAPEVVGRYEILHEIGRGGMAVVYAARQTDLDRQVALKELSRFHAGSAEFAHRFLRESRLAGSLNHPNVVTVHEYFEHAGTPYIAMEYVTRGSLRRYMKTLSFAQMAGVLEGVLAGLTHAESAGIVHRDLKPENIMVASDGRVKITDFGIARATQRAGTQFMTATGMTVGTPTYMAPEQAMAGDIGPWTDLYSVGVLAYEAIVGRVPFHDVEAPMVILMKHVNERIPSPIEVRPDVDPTLSEWVDSLLLKDPKQRVRHAWAAWESLEDIVVGELGPLWRRNARLLDDAPAVPGAAPLTPAPFDSKSALRTPTPQPSPVAQPEPPADAFVTFGAPSVEQPESPAAPPAGPPAPHPEAPPVAAEAAPGAPPDEDKLSEFVTFGRVPTPPPSPVAAPTYTPHAPPATPPADPVATPPADPVATPPADPVATPPADPVATPPAGPVATPPAAPAATPPAFAPPAAAPPAATPPAATPPAFSPPAHQPPAAPAATPPAGPAVTPPAAPVPTPPPFAPPAAAPPPAPAAAPPAGPAVTPPAEPVAPPVAQPPPPEPEPAPPAPEPTAPPPPQPIPIRPPGREPTPIRPAATESAPAQEPAAEPAPREPIPFRPAASARPEPIAPAPGAELTIAPEAVKPPEAEVAPEKPPTAAPETERPETRRRGRRGRRKGQAEPAPLAVTPEPEAEPTEAPREEIAAKADAKETPPVSTPEPIAAAPAPEPKIQEAPVPEVEERPAAATEAPPAKAADAAPEIAEAPPEPPKIAPLPPAEEAAPSAVPERQRSFPLVAAAVVLGLAAAAVGFVIAPSSGGGSSSTASSNSGKVTLSQTASAGPLTVSYPAGWQRGATAPAPADALKLANQLTLLPGASAQGGAFVIGTASSVGPTLLPATLTAALSGTTPSAATVQLGQRYFRRYLDLQPSTGSPTETVYAIATSSGTVIASCVSASTNPAAFAAECELLLSHLQITGTVLPLTANPAYATALSSIFSHLNKAQTGASQKLSSANSQSTQAAAARQLSQAYGQAASATAKLSPGPTAATANTAVVAALHKIGGGYSALASAAAGNHGHAYTQAQSTINQGNSQLQAAIAQLKQNGYTVG